MRRFATTEQSFMAADLGFEERKELKTKPEKDHVYQFGGLMTDYMLEVDYDYSNGGWQRPMIKPNVPF
jgi:hypothetical protein